jgi:hypothetical protein
MPGKSVVEKSVFLNFPYDSEYFPLFTALIAGLVALGRIPRCAIEAQDEGIARLAKIYNLLAGCGSSIHDLSRVTLSGTFKVPRFNMPFELGIAYALAQKKPHRIFTFDEQEYRLDASLSDMKAFDSFTHGGTPEGILRNLLKCFGTSAKTPKLKTLISLNKRLFQVASRARRDFSDDDLFNRPIFVQLVEAATTLSEKRKLISR